MRFSSDFGKRSFSKVVKAAARLKFICKREGGTEIERKRGPECRQVFGKVDEKDGKEIGL